MKIVAFLLLVLMISCGDNANVGINPSPQALQSVAKLNSPPNLKDDLVDVPYAKSVLIDVLSNDLFPDVAKDLKSLTTLEGTCSIKDGKLLYSPAQGFTGPASCVYEICNQIKICSSATVTINVLPGLPPVITNIPDSSLLYEPGSQTPIVLNVPGLVTDPDGNDIASITVTTQSPGGSCLLSDDNKIITFVPSAGFTGSQVTCEIKACDFQGQCVQSPILVNLYHAPVAQDSSVSVAYNTSGSAPIIASDLDNDLLFSTLEILSGSSTVCRANKTTGKIDYVLTTGIVSAQSCKYKICDSKNLCATATVTLNISTANSNPPVLAKIEKKIQFNTVAQEITANIRAFISDADGASDIQGQAVTLTNLSGGICSLSGDKLLFAASAGYAGDKATCNYSITDKSGKTGTGSIEIDLFYKPQTKDIALAVPYLGTGSVNVFAQTIDHDGSSDLVTLTIVSDPSGVCSVAGGAINYVLKPGVTGSASCVFQVTDAAGLSSQSTLTLNIAAGKNPPKLADITKKIQHNISLVEIQANIRSSISDLDGLSDIQGQVVTVSSLTGGVCSLNGDKLNFKADAAYTGDKATCSYSITDKSGLTGTGNIIVDLFYAPIAKDIAVSVPYLGSGSVDIFSQTIDHDGLTNLTNLAIVSDSNSVCSVSAGKINYTLKPGLIGSLACVYKVTDAEGLTSQKTLTLNISIPAGSIPVANNASFVIDYGTVKTVNLFDYVSDSNGQADINLSGISLVSNATGGSCSRLNNTVTFTPNAGFEGNAGSCTYKICDFSQSCVNWIVSFTVSPSPKPVMALNTAPDKVTQGSSLNNFEGSFKTTMSLKEPNGTTAIASTAQVTLVFLEETASGNIELAKAVYKIGDEIKNPTVSRSPSFDIFKKYLIRKDALRRDISENFIVKDAGIFYFDKKRWAIDNNKIGVNKGRNIKIEGKLSKAGFDGVALSQMVKSYTVDSYGCGVGENPVGSINNTLSDLMPLIKMYSGNIFHPDIFKPIYSFPLGDFVGSFPADQNYFGLSAVPFGTLVGFGATNPVNFNFEEYKLNNNSLELLDSDEFNANALSFAETLTYIPLLTKGFNTLSSDVRSFINRYRSGTLYKEAGFGADKILKKWLVRSSDYKFQVLDNSAPTLDCENYSYSYNTSIGNEAFTIRLFTEKQSAGLTHDSYVAMSTSDRAKISTRDESTKNTLIYMNIRNMDSAFSNLPVKDAYMRIRNSSGQIIKNWPVSYSPVLTQLYITGFVFDFPEEGAYQLEAMATQQDPRSSASIEVTNSTGVIVLSY